MVKVRVQSKTGDKALNAIKSAVSSEIKRLEIGLRKTNRQIDVRSHRPASEVSVIMVKLG